MKKLKKLSLKEEVDREAQDIEKEVESRDDLDDIKVSEDMETAARKNAGSSWRLRQCLFLCAEV